MLTRHLNTFTWIIFHFNKVVRWVLWLMQMYMILISGKQKQQKISLVRWISMCLISYQRTLSMASEFELTADKHIESGCNISEDGVESMSFVIKRTYVK